MKSYPSLSKKSGFNTITGFVLLAMIWLIFTPVQFGGRAVYLIISGTSMEPRFHTGDLVILHQTDTYQKGDIAAYYHPIAAGIVIHRIVEQQGNRFILLGDNKPAVDLYQPTLDEMVGKFWLYIPGVGKIISQLQALGLSRVSIVAIILAILLIPSIAGYQRQARLKQGRHSSKQGARDMNQLNLNKINNADFIFFLIVLALASSALAFFSFNQPLTKTIDNDITYKQSGTFSYSATPPPGIYNSDVAQTGAPIFRELINQVTVNFDYRLTSEAPADIKGSYRLVAQLSHKNGWHWTIELTPQTPFKGAAFSASSVVDLSKIQAVLDNLEQQTGLQDQRYGLAIVPEVSIGGTLNGQILQAEFSPPLTFDFETAQMKLADNRLNAPAGDPLNPSQAGSVAVKVEAPNVISFLGFSPTISTLRRFAILGLTISLGGLLIFGWLMFRVEQGGEVTQIKFKYSSLLINIQESGLEAAGEIIDVAAIDDLVQLAKREGRVILHYAKGEHHQYLVKDGLVVYRYQLHNQAARSNLPVPERSQ